MEEVNRFKTYKPGLDPMKRRYLEINGIIYERIRTNRAQDLYVGRNTENGKIETFSYLVVRNIHQPVYSMTEVCELLGRGRKAVATFMYKGVVPYPRQPRAWLHKDKEKTSKLNGKIMHYWSREELLKFRDAWANSLKYENHKNPLPTRRELERMLDNDTILYVKTKDGFKPTFAAESF